MKKASEGREWDGRDVVTSIELDCGHGPVSVPVVVTSAHSVYVPQRGGWGSQYRDETVYPPGEAFRIKGGHEVTFTAHLTDGGEGFTTKPHHDAYFHSGRDEDRGKPTTRTHDSLSVYRNERTGHTLAVDATPAMHEAVRPALERAINEWAETDEGRRLLLLAEARHANNEAQQLAGEIDREAEALQAKRRKLAALDRRAQRARMKLDGALPV